MAIFFLMLGVYLLEKDKIPGGMMALAASFLSKFSSVLLLPWLMLRSPHRKYLWVFGLVSVLGYVPYMHGFAPLKRAAVLFEAPTVYARDWYFNAGLYAVVSKILANGMLAKKVLFGGLFLTSFWMAYRVQRLLSYGALMISGTLLVSPVVHPWYVCWLTPFLCFYPLWSGILWTGLVGLSYWVLPVYLNTQVWQLPTWISCVEYGTVFAIFLIEAGTKFKYRPLGLDLYRPFEKVKNEIPV